MEAATLARYADTVTRVALGVGEGDVLAVHGEVAHRDLALALAESAYRAGAHWVDVVLFDPRLKRVRALGAPLETLAAEPAWHAQRMRELLERDAALVSIAGASEPDLMADVPPERAALDSSHQVPGRDVYLQALARSDARFSVVPWATPAWARRVYPELDEAAAIAALARDIARFVRIAPDDAVDAWPRHVARLEQAAQRLTGRELRELHLRGPGTDLHLALPPGTLWCGGTLVSRTRRVSPNLPTEEVFTSPSPAASEGVFRCTRPLNVAGRVIEGIRGELRGGRLVQVEAERPGDGEFLRRYLERDEGAGRLGEVALVDGAGRVGGAGRTYWTTLLDENAASHIAFGQGFGFARAAGAEPVNESALHLDVMIGSPELEVQGLDASGASVPVLVEGVLA